MKLSGRILMMTVLFSVKLYPCQCPVIKWTKASADKYDVIFRGIIKNITQHQNNYTVVEMEVLNLFKGNSYKLYRVLCPENDDCSLPVNIGEEWLIYGKGKQMNSCEIDWCGLSRKKFANDNEDFFIATHILTYDEEFKQLQNNFSEIKINENIANYQTHKNIIPDRQNMYIYLGLSLAGFFIFLYLSKKYFK